MASGAGGSTGATGAAATEPPPGSGVAVGGEQDDGDLWMAKKESQKLGSGVTGRAEHADSREIVLSLLKHGRQFAT